MSSSAPAAGPMYLVERELEQDGYAALKALVAEYLDECERLGQTPMAASPLERYLDNV